MEWAPLVIKEIIAAFRQQHTMQDNEKLKNIVREVMTENVNREQNKLLSEIMTMLNKDSAQSSREADRTAMERDQLKKECERLTAEMEKLMRQDKKVEKKQEGINELSFRQKTLLKRVNELKKTNTRKGRSQSSHRNADGNEKPATNQSQGQQQSQPQSHGAFSKYKHHHPAMKGKATNPSFSRNSDNDSKVYSFYQHHPPPLIIGQNANGQPVPSPNMNAFQQYKSPGVGQQNYQGAGVSQQQYHGVVGQQEFQGGLKQYQSPGYGQQQYPNPNPQGFLQDQQNPQLHQQRSHISQPYSSNPGQPYQQHQNGQQQQPQFGSTEAIFQQSGRHQQFQQRGQYQRGQFQQRGHFQQRGKSQQRGQFHHRGGFHQQRGNFQPKDGMQIKDEDSLVSQLTAEELNDLKEMLKQKKQQGQQENKDAGPGSQIKTEFKKKRKKRKAKPQINKGEDSNTQPQEVNDDDNSDAEDDLDEVKKKAQMSFKAQLEALEKHSVVQDGQRNTEPEEAIAQSITHAEATEIEAEEATEIKEKTAEETATAFSLCVASGLDISKLQEKPEWDALLSSMVLVAKSGNKTDTCQPKTVAEVIEFKKRYPNAEVLVLNSFREASTSAN